MCEFLDFAILSQFYFWLLRLR